MLTIYEKFKQALFKADPELEKEVKELKFGCKVINKEFGWDRTIVRSDNYKVVYIPKNDNDFSYDHLEHYQNGKFAIIGRDITLEDVLRALEKKYHSDDDNKHNNGLIMKDDWGADVGCYAVAEILELWDLGKPAREQNEETLKDLIDILK